MRINSINSYCLKPVLRDKTCFCRNDDNKICHPILKPGQIIDPTTKAIFNRNTTSYFRDDLNWKDFGKYIEEKFANFKKVNTYIWGCSEGHEAYSLSMLTESMKNGSKFYPIKAMDIMPFIISANKTRQKTDTFIGLYEYDKISSVIGPQNMKKSFEPPVLGVIGLMKIADGIKDKVEFSCSNIVTDMGMINHSNPSIIMCRNMWPYIDPEMYDECAKTMYDRLMKGSIVVVGKFDLDGDYRILGSDNFPDALENTGFKPIDKAQGKLENYKGYRKKPALIYEKP